ncbi:MAG TPA: tRNA (guanosine(46)-N7)-methyltransferase TrmB [Xanthobacteraceae bacterium]|nr:tRNA (guanosine(46)-N7)-methyltransferase TrmB [Xanthobacteraceae bacterium]
MMHETSRSADRQRGAASEPAAPEPARAFFGRRKGHPLRPHQAGLFEQLLPRLAMDLATPAPQDLRALFDPAVEEVRLEIGFGGGEHLIAQARANPGVGFLGCEPFVNGMAKALAAIEAHGLRNVRLHFGDAAALLPWLPAAVLSRIDLLYPDPWPKRRHWKRRFVQAERIAEIARVLAPGGTFRFATDWPDYAAWTLERVLRSGALTWTAERADDWRKPWPGYVGTRYEAKAVRAGRMPCYLVFRRD